MCKTVLKQHDLAETIVGTTHITITVINNIDDNLGVASPESNIHDTLFQLTLSNPSWPSIMSNTMNIVAATNSVALFVASQLSLQENRLKTIINDEKNIILKLEEKVDEYKRVIDVHQLEQKEIDEELNDERGIRVRQEQELDSLKIAYREKARKCLAWEKAYNSVREQLVGKGQVQEYERDSAISSYNQSSNSNSNFNHLSSNRPMLQINETSLPVGVSSNNGYRDDGGGNNSPSKRRFRRMETITATTFKMATPNQSLGNGRANLNSDFDQRQKTMLPLGQTLSRRYEDHGQPLALDFNKDSNRFNYIEDDPYLRGNRNTITNNQANFKTNTQHGTTNNVNQLMSSPNFPSNRLKRPLPRGQFFD